MKKLLALVLALVMTLSLCVVSSNAAYSDASSINEDYSEAIDVMSMIGVFSGMDDGSFNPTGALTREQGAKILTYMLLGKTGGDALAAGSAPYSDVAADRWSAGSIAYCTSEGIIAGDGKGSFNPEGELTGYAFAKMLLCALGYDAKIEGLTGSDWQINASKLAITAGLNDKLEGLAFGSVMTREKAAQMAFNAEVGKMVYYADRGTEITTTDGTSIVVGASQASYRTNGTTGFGNTLNDAGGWTQFAEVYTSKLTRAAAATVQNGLVGHTYTFGGDKSAWAMDGTIVATVNDGTSIAKLVDNTNAKYIGYAMNNSATPVAADATMKVVDGGTTSTNVGTMTPAQIATALTATYDEHRGVEIVFQDTDDDNDWDNVAVVMNTLAKLSGAPTTKTSGSVTTVTVPGIAGLMANDVKASNVFGYEGLAKGDYVEYHTDGTRWYLTKCEPITGTVTAFSASSGGSITVDGTAIKMSQIKGIGDTAASIYTAAKGEANTAIYKDLAGYVVKAVAAETAVDLSNTLYLVADLQSGYIEQGKILLSDGNARVVTITKVDDTSVDGISHGAVVPELFYTFTTNADGTYNLKTIPASKGTQATLTAADAAGNNNTVTGWDGTTLTGYNTNVTTTTDTAYTISKNAANFLTTWKGTGAATIDTGTKNGILANANTTFVIGNQPANTTTASNKFTVYTGISNVPNVAAYNDQTTAAYDSKIAYLVQDGYATFVVAYNSFLDNTSTAAKYAFITGDPTSNYDADKKEDYYVYPAIVDGEVTTIETVASPVFTNGTSTSGALYAITQYDGERASVLNSQGGQINLFTNARTGGSTGYSLTGIDDIKISGNTISFIDNGVTADAGTVTASTKYFLSDRTGSSTVNSVIDADIADGLTGASYAVYAINTSASDSTFKEVYITATTTHDVELTVKVVGTVSTTDDTTVVVSDVNAAANGTWTAGANATTIAGGDYYTVTGAFKGKTTATTLTFTVDPNATIKVYQGAAAAADADDLVANAGTYTIPANSSYAANQVITIAVTNNGTTNYYLLTVDCDN